MAAPLRLLWTGPYSADLLGRAIEQVGALPGFLWIVPTSLARAEVAAELMRRRSDADRPAVYSWDDLWIEAARRSRRAPSVLSAAASRSTLIEAVDEAGLAGELGPIDGVADRPGMRRSLRARFDAWTRAERDTLGPPPRDDAVTVGAWSAYRRYRSILARHGHADESGLAVWASKAVCDGVMGRPSGVVLIDPVAPSPARARVMEWAWRTAPAVLATLPSLGKSATLADDPEDPAVETEDRAIADALDSLSGVEFTGIQFNPAVGSGRAAVEGRVFAPDARAGDAKEHEGLAILGAPEGEGSALFLAREVSRRLERGVRPDEIVVLVRHWDDASRRAVDVLRSWGLPVSGGGPMPLAASSAVSALRLATTIPSEGWEVGAVVRLLRNGQLNPEWGREGNVTARAEAASTLQALRIFRGRRAIESALDSKKHTRDDDRIVADHRRAREVFDRLAAALEFPDRPAPWSVQVGRLRLVADRLRIGAARADRESLDALWTALDDHATLPAVADRPIGRDAFAVAVEAIAAETDGPSPRLRAGTVRFMTVEEFSGIRPRVTFLIGLGEGTFPTRSAVASDPDVDDPSAVSLAFSSQRLDFRRAIGSALDEAVLLVPTADARGQTLLPAGFVEDVRWLIGQDLQEPIPDALTILDPTFRAHPELARSPGDARILALAMACLDDRDREPLLRLTRDPEHREALEGIAAGFHLIHRRLRVRRFTSHDGLLDHPILRDRLLAEFGPEHAFSPSQIESFALCPFQFFQRFVLKIAATDDRPELREDFAGRGERLHNALETVHNSVHAEGPDADLLDRLDAFIASLLAGEDDLDEGAGDVAGGLKAIDAERVRRSLEEYRRDFRIYQEKRGGRPRHFEMKFGIEDDADAHPALELGEGGCLVKLRGMIDRVDLIDGDGDAPFRVIDYKTGPPPSGPEVFQHLRALQLPLYAMAAERFLFGGEVDGCEFGYWPLRDGGYRPIDPRKVGPWPEFRRRVVVEVLRITSDLRRGVFPVDPKRKDCRRHCDYKVVCRIGQARDVGKVLVTIGPP